MARRVRSAFRKLPDDVHHALVNTRNMTSTGAYNKMTRQGLKPVTPIKTIRRMAKSASKRSGIPIKVTTDTFTRKHNNTEGTCARLYDTKTKKRRVEIHLHPILEYSHKTHVADVINHELDHAKVERRVIKHKNRKYEETWRR